jgi:hypothetical protein
LRLRRGLNRALGAHHGFFSIAAARLGARVYAFVANGAGREVTSVSLDDFARDHPAPRVVKIDVEGAELRVLRGAERLLREHRPILVCELHGRENREQVRGLLEGYEFSTLESERRLVAVPVRA